MIERDVRFVQLYDRGWDSHTNIEKQHVRQCHGVDRPIAALIKDLKQRGLLEDTLVIWGGGIRPHPGRPSIWKNLWARSPSARLHHVDDWGGRKTRIDLW